MSKPNDIKLRCYHNGRLVHLAVQAAWELFWACHYSWLTITDFYRWNIDGFSGQSRVRPKVSPAPRRLALKLHCRSSGRYLTIDDLEKLENAEDAISAQVFQARAARFNIPVFGDPEKGGLPSQFRPFYHYLLTEDDRREVHAYCMYPDRECLVILNVVPGTGTIDDVDWSRFESAPPGRIG
jgi:hypothetical protein